MQIDAIYKDGVFRPLTPLPLKDREIRLKITVPDDLFESGQAKEGIGMREKINAILGEYAHVRPKAMPEDDRAAWRGHLERKYGS
jgi:predicted DNA-binding antitoxin AbrB/MazE fold protein